MENEVHTFSLIRESEESPTVFFKLSLVLLNLSEYYISSNNKFKEEDILFLHVPQK